MFNNSKFNLARFNLQSELTINVRLTAVANASSAATRQREFAVTLEALANISTRPTTIRHSGAAALATSTIDLKSLRDVCRYTDVAGIGSLFAAAQATYNEAINASERFIQPRVEIFFDGIDEAPVVFEMQSIDSLSLLEEIKAKTNGLIDDISANELTLSLDNSGRLLSPTNVDSPYYGKLKPKIPIKAYLDVYSSETHFYSIALGQFYSDDWQDSTDLMTVSVAAYDRLYFEMGEEFVGSRMQDDITFYDLFALAFTMAGYDADEYIIDDQLKSAHIKAGWLPAGTWGEVLRVLAKASQAYVTVDREDRIVVTSMLTQRPYRGALDDDNQIVAMRIPTAYNGIFSKLTTSIYDTTTDEEQSLFSTTLQAEPGTTELPAYRFNSAPVYGISRIEITAANTYVTSIDNTVDSILLTITNEGAAEEISINIYGHALKQNARVVTDTNSEAAAIIGDRTLTWDDPLIQDEVYAASIKDAMFPLLSNPSNNINIEYRGDPALRPGYSIVAEGRADKVKPTTVFIYRSTLTFEGGLEGTIAGYAL